MILFWDKVLTTTNANLNALLDCSIEVWTRHIHAHHTHYPKHSGQLIATTRPVITVEELVLIELTVKRVTKRKPDCQRAAGKPIETSGLHWRRQVTLMSIAVAVMHERGLKRWEVRRDYSKYRKRA